MPVIPIPVPFASSDVATTASPALSRVHRPEAMGAFQFVVLSSLRAVQLTRGCLPRIDGGNHKRNVIAQLEVAEGKVMELVRAPATVDDPVAEATAEEVLV